MNDVNKPQETELDRILREAASFDEAEEAKRRAAVRKAARETRATTPKNVPARPDRGVPIEKRIMANMKANAEKKAEEKQAREEKQALEAQKALLFLRQPIDRTFWMLHYCVPADLTVRFILADLMPRAARKSLRFTQRESVLTIL